MFVAPACSRQEVRGEFLQNSYSTDSLRLCVKNPEIFFDGNLPKILSYAILSSGQDNECKQEV